jgi:hypothetical protein
MITSISHALATTRTGNLVVAGTVEALVEPFHRQFLVALFDSNGRLDPAFDGDGVARTDMPGVTAPQTPLSAEVNGLVVQPDGLLVVGGSATLATRAAKIWAVARYQGTQ